MGDLASAIGIRAEEQDLVAELKTGSEQAFAMLIAQYSHPIYSLIARRRRRCHPGSLRQGLPQHLRFPR